MSVAWRIQPGAVFAATAGAKTFLMAIAPAGFGLKLCKFKLSMDGVTATAVPATVDIVTSTQATAGTPASGGSAATITRVRGRNTSGHVPTAGCNYTAEPTVLTVIDSFYLAQYMGLIVEEQSLDKEIETDSSGGTILAVGIRINVSANVNVKGYLTVEALG
jgi:hypothetical protein